MKFYDAKWLVRHRRAVLIVVGLFVVIDVVLLGYFFSLERTVSEPGGLDGCVVGVDGDPVTATVQIASLERMTYADGCFFFAAVSPGTHDVTVITDTSELVVPGVEVITGQAITIGTVQMP